MIIISIILINSIININNIVTFNNNITINFVDVTSHLNNNIIK